MDIYIDRDGNLWLGTSEGVSWAPHQQAHFFHPPRNAGSPTSCPPGDIPAVAAGPDDEAWIGSWGGGLTRYDARHRTFSRIPRIGPQVYALCVDNTGTIWASTNEPQDSGR